MAAIYSPVSRLVSVSSLTAFLDAEESSQPAPASFGAAARRSPARHGATAHHDAVSKGAAKKSKSVDGASLFFFFFVRVFSNS